MLQRVATDTWNLAFVCNSPLSPFHGGIRWDLAGETKAAAVTQSGHANRKRKTRGGKFSSYTYSLLWHKKQKVENQFPKDARICLHLLDQHPERKQPAGAVTVCESSQLGVFFEKWWYTAHGGKPNTLLRKKKRLTFKDRDSDVFPDKKAFKGTAFSEKD